MNMQTEQRTDSQMVWENSQPLINLKLTDYNDSLRILHVDDDIGFLEVSKQILEMEDKFEIDNTTSTEEAFQKLGKQSYDAIVSDYEMPSKNGLQFLKELREQGSTIPFAIFTGKSREEVAIKALNLGADGYFTKTGDPETVYAELAHGLRKSVEIRRAKAKACIEEARLKAILSSSPDAIIIADLNDKIVNCNDAAVNLTGYLTKREIIGRNAFEVGQKRGIKKLSKAANGLVGQSTIRKAELSFIKDSGEEGLVELSVGMLKDELGNPLGFVSVLRDISERKRAEEQNRKLADELNRVFDAIPDMMFIIDMDNRIVRVNKRTCEFLKKKPNDLLGKHCFEVMHGTDKRWRSCPHAKVLETKKVSSAVIDDPHVGTQLLVTVSPVFDNRGEFVHCVHSAKDVSAFKRAKELAHQMAAPSPNQAKA
jgi:PAS domain S-box-containing protein